MTGAAVEKKPGASSLVQRSTESAAVDSPGKRTLTEQLPAAPARTYTVRAGDTLQAIAAKLGTTVEAIKAANAGKLKSYPTKSGGTVYGFTAGETISIPGAAESTPAPVAPAPETPAPAAQTPAATEGPGVIDRVTSAIGGAMHDAWDFLTGSSEAPVTDAHPADLHPTGSATAGNATAGNATAGKTEAAKPAAGNATAGKTAATTASTAASNANLPTAAAPMADLTDAQRSEQLSTMKADELGTIDKFGMSKTGRDAAIGRGQWLTASSVKAAGAGKSGDKFVESVDALVDKTKFTEQQDEIIKSAKEFATAPKALDPAQEKKGTIDWSKALLTLDGVSLNDDLKGRLTRYVRFLAWAGLVTGPTTAGSVMRSPQAAHKLSVAWMFNVGANKGGGSSLHKADNRQKLVANVTASGGSDSDGNQWLSQATVDGLKAKKDDDVALFDYIKTTAAPEANKIQVQPAIAAEGYTTSDKRHPNVLGGSSVSNHLLGEAVDLFPPFVFSNKFDPMIDAIAAYFGLWRAVKDNSSSPEHWHYERLGMPPGAEADDEH